MISPAGADHYKYGDQGGQYHSSQNESYNNRQCVNSAHSGMVSDEGSKAPMPVNYLYMFSNLSGNLHYPVEGNVSLIKLADQVRIL